MMSFAFGWVIGWFIVLLIWLPINTPRQEKKHYCVRVMLGRDVGVLKEGERC